LTVAIITRAAQGMGRATASLRRSAKVVLLDLQAEKAAGIARKRLFWQLQATMRSRNRLAARGGRSHRAI
jgi:NAD(P)-dependent dehydrogenase (short-subunit alcohol dehydrogenase family)